jgi:hypothetical protein
MYSKFYLFTYTIFAHYKGWDLLSFLSIISNYLTFEDGEKCDSATLGKPISGCWYLYQTSCIQRVLFQYESMPKTQSVMYFFSVASILSNGLSISVLSTGGGFITQTSFTVFSVALWLVKGTFYSGLIYLLLLQTEPTC